MHGGVEVEGGGLPEILDAKPYTLPKPSFVFLGGWGGGGFLLLGREAC